MATRSKGTPPDKGNDELLERQGVVLDALAPVQEPVAPKRPDLTPAQLISGVPVIAEFLHAFGVYDLSQAQTHALYALIAWGAVLVFGDAWLRGKRNEAHAVVEAARVSRGG